MAKNRGSSTRKHKLNQQRMFESAKPPNQHRTTKKEQNNSKNSHDSSEEGMIKRLEDMIRSGKNRKGKTLTDSDISRIKTTISNLESKLGIQHPELTR